jgi:hypothetical protein
MARALGKRRRTGSVDTTQWVRHGNSILDRLTTTQAAPPNWVIVVTGLIALAAVAYRPVWRVCRNVVTIVHEGGHALVAVLVGRSIDTVRLHSDTSGVTVSRGKPYGLGMIATLMAGYPAPPLFGLGFAALLAAHRVTLMLWLSIALLLALLLKVRNAYGALAVVVTAGLIFAVSWFGADQTQAAFAYLAAWFLLLAGLRPVVELRRTRGYAGRQVASDADQLAQLTRLPAGLWLALFGLAALAALGFGARLLIVGTG